MQPPAVPDLAHTHARPVHWLATATAMAAVVAAAGLLQPGAATATTTTAGSGTTAPRPAPDAATADYPCSAGEPPSRSPSGRQGTSTETETRKPSQSYTAKPDRERLPTPSTS